MRRAFVILYSLIVVAVVGVGWGLDKLWQHYNPDEQTHRRNSLQLTTQALAILDAPARDALLLKVQQQTGQQMRLLHLDDFASSLLLTRIEAGEWVQVQGQREQWHYQKLPDESWVLSWQEPTATPWLYDLMLFSFYAAIALVVWLWAWPLSRDLSKLEKQTRYLGVQPVPPTLSIGPGSAVYGLASAFNAMSQRVRELLAAQKEMTYAVSHELRTPLARMKFGLEMAQNLDQLPKVQQQLAGVREDVNEMDALVNQLFAYAGFEQSDQPLDLQRGDLPALAEQLIERVRASQTANEAEFALINRLSRNEVVCEWYLMERALINLLLNAQRYAKRHVTVSLSDSPTHYQIAVDDDGPGIAPEERERVFQSFVRLTDHTNATCRGLGLGLAIVARILRWHKGEALAEASSMGGARLLMRWPKEGSTNMNGGRQ